MAQWGEYQGRIEDNRLVTGQGVYAADLAPRGMAHAVVVRSQVASARVTSIDTHAALASPGVLAVYTGKDLAADGLPDFPCGVELKRPDGQKAYQARRPILARDRIRAVGEPVAFVVAETLDAAMAAAELVVVETEDIATVATVAAARTPAGAPSGTRRPTISLSSGRRATRARPSRGPPMSPGSPRTSRGLPRSRSSRGARSALSMRRIVSCYMPRIKAHIY